MFENMKEKLTFKNKKMKLKKTIIISLVIVIAIGGFFGYKSIFGTKAGATLTTAQVTKGDISVTISGTGTIVPVAQYDITSLVKGDIIEAPLEQGQVVNKGDLLYKIDTKDLVNSTEKAKLSLEQSQLTYNKAVEDLSKLTIYAPSSGTITNLYVKNGDSISSNAKIADLIDSKTMILKIPFISSDADSISAGAYATITMSDTYQTLSGTVRRVATGENISVNGIGVKTVEIAVSNPGSIQKGAKATATVGSVACNELGDFNYNEETTINAEASGKISSLPYQLGDFVPSGSVIAKLTSDSTKTTNEQNALSVKNAQLSLQSQYDQMGNYNISSPINGTILQKTSKLGDTLDNSTTKVVMAVVADLSKIIFKINVDELDIAKLKLQQEVNIKADALPNKSFTGNIDYISIVGTTTNGVTTYPVTVVVNNPEGLIPGMNVDAEIVVDSRTNVLKVPVSAVNRGNMVTVKSADSTPNNNQASNNQGNAPADTSSSKGSAGQSSGQGSGGARSSNQQGSGGTGGTGSANQQGANNIKSSIPDGYKIVKVETGLSDSNFIEIVSGLQEGELVLLPTLKATTTTTQTSIMGGGVPGGGMQGGGNGGYRPNGNTNNSTRGGGGN